MQNTRPLSPLYAKLDDDRILAYKASVAIRLMAQNIAGIYSKVSTQANTNSASNNLGNKQGRPRKSKNNSVSKQQPERSPPQVFKPEGNTRLGRDRLDNSHSLDRTTMGRATMMDTTFTSLAEQLKYLKEVQTTKDRSFHNVFNETDASGTRNNANNSNIEQIEEKFASYLLKNAEREKIGFYTDINSQRYTQMYNKLTNQTERLLSPDHIIPSDSQSTKNGNQQRQPSKEVQRVTENYYVERQSHNNASGTLANTTNQRSFKQHVTDRQFTVTVEKPVVMEKIVERPYDVYIEKPVKNIIEKEIVTERFVDKPVKRIIDYEFEKVIHKPVENIVEKKVFVDKIVEYEVENLIDKPVEVIKEVQVPYDKVVDKPVSRLVVQPYRREVKTKETLLEEPVYEDVIVEKPVHRTVDRYIDVPDTQYVEKEYIKEVEVPVYRQINTSNRQERSLKHNIDISELQRKKMPIVRQKVVEKPYEVIIEIEKPVNRVVTKEIEVPIYKDRIVEKNVDKYIDKPFYIDKKIEVPKMIEVDKYIDIERVEEIEETRLIDKPVELNKVIEIEVRRTIPKYVEIPKDIYKDVPVIREVIIPIEKPVVRTTSRSVSVPRIIEIEIEKTIEVPVTKYIDREIIIDKVVDTPVYIDKVIEVPKEVIYERVIEVPVTKYVQVPKHISREEIVDLRHTQEAPVYTDRSLKEEISYNRNQILVEKRHQNLKSINQLENEITALSGMLDKVSMARSTSKSPDIRTGVIGAERNRELRLRFENLHDEMYQISKSKSRDIKERYNRQNLETMSQINNFSNRDSRYSNNNSTQNGHRTNFYQNDVPHPKPYTVQHSNHQNEPVVYEKILEREPGITIKQYTIPKDKSSPVYKNTPNSYGHNDHIESERRLAKQNSSGFNRDSTSPDVSDIYFNDHPHLQNSINRFTHT